MLGTFLRKFKSGGYRLQDCETKSDRMKLGKRARAFLDVFAPVFEEYQKRLSGRIDFEDMILRAAHYAETGRYVSPFRHILVDEFQDISQSRARLVKALKAQHSDVRIFAVGDDWQSIFRFAGSDIHLMRHFGREFSGCFDGEASVHRTVDLGRTFRSIRSPLRPELSSCEPGPDSEADRPGRDCDRTRHQAHDGVQGRG
jgi:DNA helicase-4